MKRFVMILLCALLACCVLTGRADPVLKDCGTEMSCGSAHYPVVEGMEDA